MVAWFAVAGAVATGGMALYGFLIKDPRDAAERDRKQAEMLAAIDQLTTSVLDTMVALNVAALRGDLNGFSATYDAYDADPNDPAEEGRLVLLIDDAARTIGNLAANIDLLQLPAGRAGVDQVADARRDLALESAAIYVPLLLLRSQAMAERQFTYRSPEVRDIPPSLHPAVGRLALLQTFLEQQNSLRFGPIDRTPLGPGEGDRLSYRLDERSIRCPGPSMNYCERQRTRHRSRELASYLGGAHPALEAAKGEIQRTLDLLSRPGWQLERTTHRPSDGRERVE